MKPPATDRWSAAPPPPADRNARTLADAIGRALMAAWIVVGLSILWYAVEAVRNGFLSRYGMNYVDGFFVTLSIVSLSLIIGAAASIPIAFARLSRNAWLGAIAYAYVYAFRGTPLIAQTFLIYYGAGSFRGALDVIGLWWFFADAFNCVVFAFSLNTAAYQAEILRGALQSVPRSQIEAAQALGLSRTATFLRVTLPQAMIVALRPYGNEVILMVKGSAIAAVVTVFDLMGETRRAFSRSYDFQAYLWAALLYLSIVETIRRLWTHLERRLTRHLTR